MAVPTFTTWDEFVAWQQTTLAEVRTLDGQIPGLRSSARTSRDALQAAQDQRVALAKDLVEALKQGEALAP